MTDRQTPGAIDEDLDDLRAELARFVLREAGQAVTADPSLPLAAAFTRAIHEEADRAARLAREEQPSPEDIAEQVLQTIRPELVRVVRAAASGEADRLGPAGLRGAIASLPGPVLAAACLLAAALIFALGFGAAWMLAPRPAAPEPVASQPVEQPGPADPGTAAPDVTPETAPAGPASPPAATGSAP